MCTTQDYLHCKLISESRQSNSVEQNDWNQSAKVWVNTTHGLNRVMTEIKVPLLILVNTIQGLNRVMTKIKVPLFVLVNTTQGLNRVMTENKVPL